MIVNYTSNQPMATLRRPLILSMTVREYFPVVEQVNLKLIALGYAPQERLDSLNESFRRQAAEAMNDEPEAGLLYCCYGDDFHPGMIGETKTLIPEYSFPGFDVVSLERFLDPEYNGPAETFETTIANDQDAIVFPTVMTADPMDSLLPADQMHKIVKAILGAVFNQTETLTDAIYAAGLTLGMTKEQIVTSMPLTFMVSKAMEEHVRKQKSKMGDMSDALAELFKLAGK